MQRKILICLLGLSALSLFFLIDSLSGRELTIQRDWLDLALFLLVSLLACGSLFFLIIKLKNIDDKIWRAVVVFGGVGFFFLNYKFGGASARIENKLSGIFTEPIMWLLIATLIGHLVLFIYKRNKPQSN